MSARFSKILSAKRLISRAALAITLLAPISSCTSSSTSYDLAPELEAIKNCQNALATLIANGPQANGDFRADVATGVLDLGAKIDSAWDIVQSTTVYWPDMWEVLAPSFPEFSNYLLKANKTPRELLSEPNTLVLLNKGAVSTIWSNLEHLYLVGNWNPTGLDLPACTSMKTLGFFDGAGLTATQRTQISTLAKNVKILQDLIVMNWGHSDIAASTFNSATSLLSVIIHNASIVRDEAFYKCTSLVTALLPQVTTIMDGTTHGAFQACRALSTIHCPDLAGDLGYGAFSDCQALTEIYWPNIATVGDGAFFRCIGLTTVSLPAVTFANAHSFQDCTALSAISMPNVGSMDGRAFYNCRALTSIFFPALDNLAGGEVFKGCTAMTTACLLAATMLDGSTFVNNTSLCVAYLPVCTTFYTHEFNNCEQLRLVIMPDALTPANEIFYGCNKLISDNIVQPGEFPDFERFLKDMAGHVIISDPRRLQIFCNRSEVSSVELERCTELYLLGNSNPTGLNLGTRNNLLTLGLFDRRALTTQRDDVEHFLQSSTSALQNVFIGNWGYSSIECSAYGPFCEAHVKNIMIGGTEGISDVAFQQAGIISASFPHAYSINWSAFAQCSFLREISCPLVSAIGAYGFEGCIALKKVSFPSARSVWESAFQGCTTLEYASFPVLTTIDSDAFRDCSSLQTIIFPQTIMPGANAFLGCPSTLQKLNP
ncbi:MAG: leucine-rich repeat domain-containing protein [Holosporales bacterium]|jgi:hypothetical protein|nr:leucine-rich repeat domain-containing protein [Holosporales bacterium]